MRNISAVYNQLIADGPHPPVEAAPALGGLLAGADLVVVEVVFLSHIDRREVRHDHIAACFKSKLPADG